MMAVFMEVLDTSIANIALPHIAGSLSATPEEATWVLTSYLVANAIVLPMTGWLGNYFGRKRVLALVHRDVHLRVGAVRAGVESADAGHRADFAGRWRRRDGADRAVHHAGKFPAAKTRRGDGGVRAGRRRRADPGPGDRRLDHGQLFLALDFLHQRAGGNFRGADGEMGGRGSAVHQAQSSRRRLITSASALLAVWLATMQIVLDKGQEADWFGAEWVRWFTLVSVASFFSFIWWEFQTDHPLVDLRVFKNRNFTIGLILMTSLAAILYGTTAQLPLFLQTLMGYPALASRLRDEPARRGGVLHHLRGRAARRAKSGCAGCCCFGFSTLAYSSFLLASINLQVSMGSVIWPSVVNGIAISFIFVPLTTTTMSQLGQAADRQCQRPVQSHAQPRRQHRHRVRDHDARARRAGASGADGRAI